MMMNTESLIEYESNTNIPSIISAINKAYSENHGYDFVSFHMNNTNFLQDVANKYKSNRYLQDDDAFAYHATMHKIRGYNWNKLQIIWSLGNHTARIMFISTDNIHYNLN
jgi:hypothetical protein